MPLNGMVPVRNRVSTTHTTKRRTQQKTTTKNPNLVGSLDHRRVLAGHQRASVDGLALGEQIGVVLVRRLLRAQPLDGRSGRGGRILDPDHRHVGYAQRPRQLDDQRRSQRLVGLGKVPVQRLRSRLQEKMKYGRRKVGRIKKRLNRRLVRHLPSLAGRYKQSTQGSTKSSVSSYPNRVDALDVEIARIESHLGNLPRLANRHQLHHHRARQGLALKVHHYEPSHRR